MQSFIMLSITHLVHVERGRGRAVGNFLSQHNDVVMADRAVFARCSFQLDADGMLGDCVSELRSQDRWRSCEWRK